MKKIILMALIFVSCGHEDPTYESSIKNLTVYESERICSLKKDTLVVSVEEPYLYIFDNGKIIGKVSMVNSDPYSPYKTHNGISIAVGLLCFGLFGLGAIAGRRWK